MLGGDGAAVFWLSSGRQPGPAGEGASLPAHDPALQLAPASEPAITTAIKTMLGTNTKSAADTDTRWQMYTMKSPGNHVHRDQVAKLYALSSDSRDHAK